MPVRKAKYPKTRYGLGEWYGRSFATLSQAERMYYAGLNTPKQERCLPRSSEDHLVYCTKKGGVCSLRLYEQAHEEGSVAALSTISTLCPHRFKEGNMIFRWVGETVLGHESPLVAREVGFLIREANEPQRDIRDEGGREGNKEIDTEDVGQIDYVLVHPEQAILQWCALELQAVYFSGAAMADEYPAIRQTPTGMVYLPLKNRRPDYRSSGPKRLMPQLQIKVPTLRRWGKKMAVVVDREFFHALGKMDAVSDISNCDIIWFVVDYVIQDSSIKIIPFSEHFTTLERAVEGLTAGKPVSLSVFESRIKTNIK